MSKVQPDRVHKTMCDSVHLIALLENALKRSAERRHLLQSPERLQAIMRSIPARQWLFEQTHPSNQRNRAIKARLFIVEIMQYSGQIWKGSKAQSIEVYEEALARTWKWFSENFDNYEPERGSFVTWFNHKLKWIIWNVIQEQASEQNRREPIQEDSEGKTTDLADLLPAPDLNRWEEMLEEWLDLVEKDPNKQLRNCRMREYPHVSCQTLLRQILILLSSTGEVSWNNLAQKNEVDRSLLLNFCRLRCSSCFKALL